MYRRTSKYQAQRRLGPIGGRTPRDPEDEPKPLPELRMRITVDLYVPTHGRCDQHAAVIDGERVGLLSATEIGRRVAAAIRKRPSIDVQAEIRRDNRRQPCAPARQAETLPPLTPAPFRVMQTLHRIRHPDTESARRAA